MIEHRPIKPRIGPSPSHKSLIEPSLRRLEIVYPHDVDVDTAYEIHRLFPVDPERLFAAFTNPAILKDIWGLQLTLRQENFETSQERNANREALTNALSRLAGLLTSSPL